MKQKAPKATNLREALAKDIYDLMPTPALSIEVIQEALESYEDEPRLSASVIGQDRGDRIAKAVDAARAEIERLADSASLLQGSDRD